MIAMAWALLFFGVMTGALGFGYLIGDYNHDSVAGLAASGMVIGIAFVIVAAVMFIHEESR